jgi:uncharacterized protein (DUF433 family)
LVEKKVLVDATITEVIPIYTDKDGRMRVSGTRVLLDFVNAYQRGETPEHIVQMYPVVADWIIRQQFRFYMP